MKRYGRFRVSRFARDNGKPAAGQKHCSLKIICSDRGPSPSARDIKRRNPSRGQGSLKIQRSKKRLLALYGDHAGIEAGLIAGGSVLMDDAFFHRFINCRDGGAISCLGLLGIAGCNGLAKLAQLGPQTRCVGAVVCGTFFSLARALQRRKMICHCCLLNSYQKVFRRVTEDAILLGFSHFGQCRAGRPLAQLSVRFWQEEVLSWQAFPRAQEGLSASKLKWRESCINFIDLRQHQGYSQANGNTSALRWASYPALPCTSNFMFAHVTGV